jgi:hypothetical protein
MGFPKRIALRAAAHRRRTRPMFKTPEKRRAVAAITAGAVMLSAVLPAAAAPVMTSTATLRAAAPDQTVDVRWRHRGGAVVGGLAAGLAIGAIAAAAARPRYYYEPGYAYAEPYYAPPEVVYEAPPVYYAPAPRYYAPRSYGPGPVRQCWVTTDDRGYGYWRPC